MPIHYDLHVWLYRRNLAGQLTAWNPKVTCAVTLGRRCEGRLPTAA